MKTDLQVLVESLEPKKNKNNDKIVKECSEFIIKSYLMDNQKNLTKDVKKFISEMSYESAALECMKIVKEDNPVQKQDETTDPTADKIRAIHNLENSLRGFIGRPLGLLAAYTLGRKASTVPGAIGAGVMGGVAGAIGGTIIARMVKFIQLKNLVACKTRAKGNSEEYRRCALEGYKKVAANIQSEISKCPQTQNPDVCEKRLKAELEKIKETEKHFYSGSPTQY